MKKRLPVHARAAVASPDWQAIASFYAGRPVSLTFDDQLQTGGTTGLPESGKIFLGKAAHDSLVNFAREWAKAKTDGQRASLAALASQGLNVLLHESMHNRHMDTGSGLKGAGDESQAIALGAELIPDMLQRFFGVRIGSPVSEAFAKAAKSRGEYQGAYAINGIRLP